MKSPRDPLNLILNLRHNLLQFDAYNDRGRCSQNRSGADIYAVANSDACTWCVITTSQLQPTTFAKSNIVAEADPPGGKTVKIAVVTDVYVAANPQPVSYTHLDVYKRQVYFRII